jgi:hypothetical protein
MKANPAKFRARRAAALCSTMDEDQLGAPLYAIQSNNLSFIDMPWFFKNNFLRVDIEPETVLSLGGLAEEIPGKHSM